MSVASTAAIRASFPALERVHLNQPVAYFDGPGGTQVPHQVGDAIADYLYEGLVRAGCACYTAEEEIERLVESVSAIAGGAR